MNVHWSLFCCREPIVIIIILNTWFWTLYHIIVNWFLLGFIVLPHLQEGITALMVASCGGRPKVVQQLLDAGASVDLKCHEVINRIHKYPN